MKKILLIFVSLLFVISNSIAQETFTLTLGNYSAHKAPNDYTDTYKWTVNNNNTYSEFNGFTSSLDFKYAFKRCFGDIVMAYGYDLEIRAFNYNGKKYTAEDLEIDDFKKYVTSVEAIFTIYPERNNSWTINSGKDEAVLSDFDVGCYGQTFKVAGKGTQMYDMASSNFFTLVTYPSVKVNFSKTLVYKVENLEKRRKEQKKRSNAYWNSNGSKSKKRTTEKKKSYWNN